MIIPLALSAETLPQDKPWKVTLRDCLQTFTTNDFDVVLAPLKYDTATLAAAFSNDNADVIYRYWVLFNNTTGAGGTDRPDHEGLRVKSKYFVLGNIESTSGIQMYCGGSKFIDPLAQCWWINFNSPINPHGEYAANMRAMKRRAFVIDEWSGGGEFENA